MAELVKKKLWYSIDPLKLAKFRASLAAFSMSEEDFYLEAIERHLERNPTDMVSGTGLREYALEHLGFEIGQRDLLEIKKDLILDFHYEVHHLEGAPRPTFVYSLKEMTACFQELVEQGSPLVKVVETKPVKKRKNAEIDTTEVEGPPIRAYGGDDA